MTKERHAQAEKSVTALSPRLIREMARDIVSEARRGAGLLPRKDDGASVKELAKKTLGRVDIGIDHIKDEELTRLIQELARARKRPDEKKTVHVFLAGEGRSGLVAKAFGMRLVHLGITAHNIDESTTPAKRRGDLLLLFSGSGTTKSCIHQAESAKAVGARVGAITSFPDSELGKLADFTVKIEGRQENEVRREGQDPVHPMGTRFELTLRVVTDALVECLMVKLDVSEKMMKLHHHN